MKRVIMAYILALILALGLAGCGKVINDTPNIVQEQVIRANTMIDDYAKMKRPESNVNAMKKINKAELSKENRGKIFNKLKDNIQGVKQGIKKIKPSVDKEKLFDKIAGGFIDIRKEVKKVGNEVIVKHSLA